jgi:hypothetical protein
MTAGYSGTPLARKLGIGAGTLVAVVDGPADLDRLLDPLPDGASLSGRLPDPAGVVLLFVTSRAALDQHLPAAVEAVFPDGAVWAAWPKRASKVPTDMTEQAVRDAALPMGLVDNKVAAISDVWSGLRLVWRKENRAR